MRETCDPVVLSTYSVEKVFISRLGSSVGRALHRYHKVMGSNPVPA